MKRDHRAQRTCLGCDARDDQKQLLRLVYGNDELQVGRLAKGRGGYLHKAQKCWDAFVRRKSVSRAFHLNVGREARERLIVTLSGRHWE